MKYFDGFAESLDITEGDMDSAQLAPDPGQDRLPFELLDDRRFEVLAYRLKCAQHGASARIALMQGVGERGRDVVVYSNDGGLHEVIQCKNLRARMTAPSVRRELLKLALHATLDSSILGTGSIGYELWCPSGFTEPAADIFNRWPTLWTAPTLEADARELISEYARLRPIRWESASAFILDTFPRLVRPSKLESVDLTPRVRSHLAIYQNYFDGTVVMDVSDVEATMRKLFAEVGGYRSLTDADAKHLMERVCSFDASQRIVTTSGYVMGLPHKLVSQFKREEFKEFVTGAIGATAKMFEIVIRALARLAGDAARSFREEVLPPNTSITHVFAKALVADVSTTLLRLTALGTDLHPEIAKYANLSLQDRLQFHAKETWDEYQRCIAGYNRATHDYGSDEEFRHRIAHHGLQGATQREEFEGALTGAIMHHLPELQRRNAAFMALVPREILVVNDTMTVFKNKWLMERMADSLKSLELLRGSAIIPE